MLGLPALVLALAAGMASAAAPFCAPPELGALRSDFSALRAERARRAEEPKSFTLRVLTYNIWGIPLGDEDEKNLALGRHDRYAEIGRMLAAKRKAGTAPHLVAIQEAFHPRTPELVKEAGYPYVAAGPGRARGKLIGSGLYILSEFPIEEQKSVAYADCTGTDCWANKSGLAVRVKVPGLARTLVFADTHLNADADSPSPTPEETRRIRILQSAELAVLLDGMRVDGEPQIIAADFNFRPGDADYNLFAGRPGAVDGTKLCLEAKCPGDEGLAAGWRESVDHQFFTPGSLSITPVLGRQVFKEPVDGTPLSDHVGLEVHYLLQTR